MDNTAHNLSSSNSGNSSTQPPSSRVDMNWIIAKATEVLKNPKGVWTSLKNEQMSVADVYKKYVLVLAAISPVSSFIGFQVFGISIPFYGTFRPPFISSLVSHIVMYAISLVTLYIAAMIISALAPKFEGNCDQVTALRLVAFSATAAQVGGILSIIPALGMLGILFGIYSLYTFYHGIPTMTGVPATKQLPYFGVTIVSILVVGIVLGLIVGILIPLSFAPDVSSQVPKSLEDGLKLFENLAPKTR